MANPNLQAEIFHIAEEAHKGASNRYILDLCEDAATEFGVSKMRIYQRAQATYVRHFEGNFDSVIG